MTRPGSAVAIGGALLLAVVGCGGSGKAASPATPQQQTLTVRMRLEQVPGDCISGHNGYDDIHPGAAVVVYDNAQHVIGTAQLESGGEPIKDATISPNVALGCIWTSHVQVPTGKGFYGIQVSHRGVLNYSEDQLKKDNWTETVGLAQS